MGVRFSFINLVTDTVKSEMGNKSVTFNENVETVLEIQVPIENGEKKEKKKKNKKKDKKENPDKDASEKEDKKAKKKQKKREKEIAKRQQQSMIDAWVNSQNTSERYLSLIFAAYFLMFF